MEISIAIAQQALLVEKQQDDKVNDYKIKVFNYRSLKPTNKISHLLYFFIQTIIGILDR